MLLQPSPQPYVRKPLLYLHYLIGEPQKQAEFPFQPFGYRRFWSYLCLNIALLSVTISVPILQWIVEYRLLIRYLSSICILS